eukprot:gene9290-10256_t
MASSTGISPIYSVAVHDAPIVSLRISPSGQFIASAGADRTLKLSSCESGEVVKTIAGEHTAGLNDCLWLADHLVVTAADDGLIKLMDIEKEKCVTTFQNPHQQQQGAVAAFPYCLAVHSQTNLLTAGYTDGSLASYHSCAKQSLARVLGHGACVTSVSYEQDGEEIVSSSHDGTVRQWMTSSSFHCIRTIVPASYSPVVRVSYSPGGGSYLLAASLDNSLRLFSRHSKEKSTGPTYLKVYQGHRNSKHTVYSSFLSRWIVSGGDSGCLTLWDINTCEKLDEVQAHSGALLAGATLASKEGENNEGIVSLYTGGADGSIASFRIGSLKANNDEQRSSSDEMYE